MMHTRRSGILLHLTSLPSPFGIGDLGPGARRFADFLGAAAQSIWQVLPLSPTSEACGNSPYCSYSAFAGNPLFISPELLVEEGYLVKVDTMDCPQFPAGRVDFEKVAGYKHRLLKRAFGRYWARLGGDCDFREFCKENAYWLDDYALFVSLKERFGGLSWCDWPAPYRNREETALRESREQLKERSEMEKFFQFLFFKQWFGLKRYCNGRKIQIVGDIPIYVSYDSSDVWANPGNFKLDAERNPLFVAGVPPDYFSETGQLWGNPVYDWEALGRAGYSWWLLRIEHNLRLFDMTRLDHFRGFVAYWEVAASEKTAIRGEWVNVPVRDFFDTLLKRFPHLPVIAEDLGVITPDVRQVMTAYGFPGMKLLHFAFGEDLPINPYAPHNHEPNCVVYTGTHDNNTTRGWFENDLDDRGKELLAEYLGRSPAKDSVHRDLLRLAMMSVADTAITPMQDVLGLGEDARMNMPSVAFGNWGWRVKPEQLTPAVEEELAAMSRLFGRA
ncbi:MAG: 4-alpha-glucanotransferase [Syntrophobacteraceae bacterium]|nr:4-alpha-glucanotransferase [Desulfobacteraceae bacterium]